MERVPLLDLKAQFEGLRPEINAAVGQVIESQAFILGDVVRAFEEQIAAYAGSTHAIGCASGTDALILSLAALGVGAGDEMVTSPFSFFSTASCAYKVGARPVFADIDPETFNIDPERVESALSARTRVLLPVHLFGQCADLDRLQQIADSRSLHVIEDAAQGLGASYRSQFRAAEIRAGAYGKLGCFSFFPSKNLGGFGDGGMILTDDAELAERLRLLRVHGGRQMYHHRWVGWNSRLDAIQAAVLGVKLPHLDDWCALRAGNAERYDRWFTESGLIEREEIRLPARASYGGHIFNQYTLRVRRRDELRKQLDTRSIGNSVYYPVPLHLQDCFRDLGYGEGDFPEAERACREVISLPVYPELPRAAQERVVSAVVDFYADSKRTTS